ncbi:ABC transporter G family member 33-like [Gossypium australe]|uniref:ABC transporter G family member 33-like n=1 Tax=Gossypium australe TaxID=47621 RepID=A0A5B6UW37_9ROSI|nr:ABC transporter G family member 33-like [Gossypium australe]
MLRRYRSDPSHIVPVEEVEMRSDLSFEEEPVEILDRDVKVLRKKTVPLVKLVNDFICDTSSPTKPMTDINYDPMKLPNGPITRSRAKQFKDAAMVLVAQIWNDDRKESKNMLNYYNFFGVEYTN